MREMKEEFAYRDSDENGTHKVIVTCAEISRWELDYDRLLRRNAEQAVIIEHLENALAREQFFSNYFQSQCGVLSGPHPN